MDQNNQKSNDRTNRELVISRLINAPRELVYKVWTDPKHADQWWGPDGFTNETIEMNVTPGGVWRYTMYGPNGMTFANRMRYTEVIANERLNYLHDSDIEDDPNGFEVTVTFEEQNGKTLLTMTSLFLTAEALEMVVREYGAIEGGKQHLKHLDDYVTGLSAKSNRDLVITRMIDAPRELVWQMWTNPEHFIRWWGPNGFTCPECKIDFREGGTYLACMRSANGKDYWSTGQYLEIIAPEKIVYTDSFADAAGNVVPASYYGMEGTYQEIQQVTLTFEDAYGKTKFTLTHAGVAEGVIRDMTCTSWNEILDKQSAIVATEKTN